LLERLVYKVIYLFMLMGPGPDTWWEAIVVMAVLAWPLTLTLLVLSGILVTAGMWKVFNKAGYAGWKCLIPFYNLYLLADIAGLKDWYSITVIVQLITVILTVIFARLNVIYEILVQAKLTSLESVAVTVAIFFVISIGVMLVYLIYSVAQKFQKGFSYALGLVFLPVIFWPILGFGDDQYQDSA